MLSATDLQSYRGIAVLIAANTDQQIQLRQLIRRLQALGVDRGAAGVVQEMVRDVDGETAALLALKAEVEQVVSSLPDPARLILKRRYVDGWEWLPIADELHYDVSTVHRLHKKTLGGMVDGRGIDGG